MIGRIVAVVLVAASMGGCATIIQGSTQSVSITSKPEDGAKCVLKNSQGTWYVTTPGSVNVHKTKTDLTVTCQKDGVGTGSVVAVAKFGGTTFGNVLAGGLIGITVDAASGANFYYDSPILVTLSAPASTPAATPPTSPTAAPSAPASATAQPTPPASAPPADAAPAATPATVTTPPTPPASASPADAAPAATPPQTPASHTDPAATTPPPGK
ncbi:MAG: hypothetical protein KGJ53_15380 [Alphaproteobacteria bacterium]|nr:hypothetical protein [Alphaproteobacteria bacterium]